MTYGKNHSIFFKSDVSVDNAAKCEMLKELSVGDLLSNLRNIEEAPREYDEPVIKAVYATLFDRGITCI